MTPTSDDSAYPEQQQAAPAAPQQAGEPASESLPEGKPSRAWLWWLLGGFVMLLLIGGAVGGLTALALGSFDGAGSGGTIAVIPFTGAIAGTGVAPSVVTPEDFLKLLDKAEKDPAVKAIVLRVDSPGGTVAASEEIASYVKNATKPIVVSVSDVDASGAYMVSSQADLIVANPGSAVGSIGVITEIPNASALLDKIGLQFQVVHAGKYKDAGTPYRPLTATETAMLQGQVDQVYEQFIRIVADGRKMPRAKVEKLATGWAWNGEEAKGLGLVDRIGTYQDALKAAAKLGHIEGEYRTDVYANQQLGGLLSALLGIKDELARLSATTSLSPSSISGPSLAK